MTPIQDYYARAQSIDGWFNRESAAIWDVLLAFQGDRGITGNLGEIGVWEGKSALLAAMHMRENEELLLIDPRSMTGAGEIIKEMCPNASCTYHQNKSCAFRGTELFHRNASTFRWFHIDGEHTSQAVHLDLEIANYLLREDGIITVDDFFSALYPQVTEAVFSFLATNSARLKLFLAGFNKAYLCRPCALRTYARHIADNLYPAMITRGCADIMFCKTTAPDDSSCFGITRRIFDMDQRGPDWDQKIIEI